MLFDFISLDRSGKDCLYETLYYNIKDAVNCSVIKKGDKLPSVRDASRQLQVSRTTVENAYNKLCIEGIAESVPQKGYYILEAKIQAVNIEKEKNDEEKKIKYDFSGRMIDTRVADTKIWKKLIRQVLNESFELNSYGDYKGEKILRDALMDYAYKMRGVKARSENIIVGAGIGPLLNILCSVLDKNITVGFENGGFNTAKSIFEEYGIKTVKLNSDKNGAIIEDILKNHIDVLFLLPSALQKISINALSNRRNEYALWAKQNNKIIIEDDYNGELRYTARTIPSFQSKLPENCVYIGSFSKLLLPSVRIAYMVLPNSLSEKLNLKKYTINQTCGKIEQLALEKYITGGAMEKHLRRLRRMYYNKSKQLLEALKSEEKYCRGITLYETSLTVELNTGTNLSSKEICKMAQAVGVRVMESEKRGCIKIGFGGIAENDIEEGIKQFYKIFQ